MITQEERERKRQLPLISATQGTEKVAGICLKVLIMSLCAGVGKVDKPTDECIKNTACECPLMMLWKTVNQGHLHL